jgi:hypothetical protein
MFSYIIIKVSIQLDYPILASSFAYVSKIWQGWIGERETRQRMRKEYLIRRFTDQIWGRLTSFLVPLCWNFVILFIIEAYSSSFHCAGTFWFCLSLKLIQVMRRNMVPLVLVVFDIINLFFNLYFKFLYLNFESKSLILFIFIIDVYL